ncbi:MAG TPA: tetratricopeptide repeat protein [Vicinamibacteria bacterium]|nr:tetratricopeptide repeat protein [Vicinamibacteria bacterium]
MAHRRTMAALLLSFASAGSAQDGGLALGLQQVREGDYEAAVVTLEAAARRLEAQAGRQGEAAQARLHLGVARVGLGDLDAARLEFRSALRLDPTLRVGEDRFSPKVVRVFESARQDVATQTAPEPKKSSKKTLLIVGGLGAAGAGIAIAASGGGGTPAPGSASFSNAQFTTPVILCPNGSVSAPLPFTVLVDASNGTGSVVTVRSASVRMTIVESPAVPSEVGQSTTQPGTAIPNNVPARTNLGLQVQSELLCTNQPSSAPRSNFWTALVTLETSAGSFNLGTAGRLEVNLP